MSKYGWIGLAFAGFLLFWQWDHNRLEAGQREQAARIDQAEIDRLTAITGQQAERLRDQRALQVALDAIGTGTRQLEATLNARSIQMRQDLAELKRNDEQVSAYLSAAVPAALGVRYARAATTDPVAWRAGPAKAVPVGPVPITGPPSAEP
ncbi:hypothetical protein [Pseudomonas viridiflava]|uniref:hypothetical protein n=1 Tax=Pseudomonas viridiflava TaxID=33069 RepID=UPI000F043684|nr:hypothetical protein [Pseudomonas viridiflava]